MLSVGTERSNLRDWWGHARDVGPPALAEEYARNIHVTVSLYGALTGEDFEQISSRIGRSGGWFQPILEVIFPDWLEDNRDLTKRSLKRWADSFFSGIPAPFPMADADIDAFCEWLERAGLYQYYWHFHRFADFGRNDSTIYRAAAAAEAVAFANLVEMIANHAFEERGGTARKETLGPKLYGVLNAAGPVDLTRFFNQFKKLTNTKRSTLKRRLAQIDRIRQGGPHALVLRAILQLWVIRNEGSHLGLDTFDRVEILEMLEAVAMASLIIWRAR